VKNKYHKVNAEDAIKHSNVVTKPKGESVMFDGITLKWSYLSLYR